MGCRSRDSEGQGPPPGFDGSASACEPPPPSGVLAHIEDRVYRLLRLVVIPALVLFRNHAGR